MSTEIIYREINISICLNIFGQTVISTRMIRDKVQIIERSDLIWSRGSTTTFRWSCRSGAISDDTVNNAGASVGRNREFPIFQFYNDCRSCRQRIVLVTVSGKNRKCCSLSGGNTVTRETVIAVEIAGSDCGIEIRH